MNDDHRSYIRNFCSCEKKTWKKFRVVRDSNPWPLRYGCTTLTSQLGSSWRWSSFIYIKYTLFYIYIRIYFIRISSQQEFELSKSCRQVIEFSKSCRILSARFGIFLILPARSMNILHFAGKILIFPNLAGKILNIPNHT